MRNFDRGNYHNTRISSLGRERCGTGVGPRVIARTRSATIIDVPKRLPVVTAAERAQPTRVQDAL
ncbi:hypothetical protein GCM10011588_11990 [Nocardia jinanensis]|uniref:Uncharacterized protein n=1 Tax=Nocardia jinanensis TaxID=382504 RepID=A0A917VNK8_9NOCA|nr:hypothetical protein GCM10011588_11990 [Nocardia jinanensis]